MEPTAIHVKPIQNYQLCVTFDNNETRLFDVKPYLNYEWYGELSDVELFNTVHIAGLSVEWLNGQDIAPECLYDDSVPIVETDRNEE
ncbi:MAG: DUF2442 domain-containing protein [Oscillospiraceae bacterium]|jgi:hypothetical protein|nr:DUF2442 domain-containing protein [Oscillospiraceae bacterium]